MKRLLLCITAGIIAALTLIALYNYTLHPEIAYFCEACRISSEWEHKLRRSGKPCYILGGGSEVRANFSPSLMLQEYGIPAVNAGAAAPFGVTANTAIALHHLKKGDTLVLSIISTAGSVIIPKDNGIKLAVQLYGTSAYTLGGIPLSFENISCLFASDFCSMIMTAVRQLTRGYGFAYEKEATLHTDGWMEVHRRGMENAKIPRTAPTEFVPSQECIQLLTKTEQTCRQIGAQFVVMLPVGFSNEKMKNCRLAQALYITRMGIPVLRDERLGCTTDTSELADMHYHFTPAATAENSRIISRLLKEKNYWSELELVERLRALGLADDGTPLP